MVILVTQLQLANFSIWLPQKRQSLCIPDFALLYCGFVLSANLIKVIILPFPETYTSLHLLPVCRLCKVASTSTDKWSRSPGSEWSLSQYANRSLLPAYAAASLPAAEESQEKSKDRSFDELIAHCQKAVVVITASDRRGESAGLGSGFVIRSGDIRSGDIRSGGVIVTNHHVIGDGRAFKVQLADGRLVEPTAILAFDRHHDLALIQVDADDLPALELGDSSAVKVGLQVATVGHPLGLRMSVARGVVAGVREIDKRSMIQVAMPIEMGNSGSPLFDMQGRVLGVVAIKSGSSLGFAVPADQVKRLLDHPHPIPIEGWITIGQMDPRRWQTLMGV